MNEEKDQRQKNPRADERVEVDTPLGKLACVLPGIWEWDLYIRKLRAGHTAVARRELVQLCAVSDATELARIFERYPALPESICDELSRLVGDMAEVAATKDGERVEVKVDGATLHFKRPLPTDYEQVDAAKLDPKASPSEAIRLFCLACTDAADEARRVFERHPGLPGPIYKALGDIAGKTLAVVAKKGVSSTGEPKETGSSLPTA